MTQVFEYLHQLQYQVWSGLQNPGMVAHPIELWSCDINMPDGSLHWVQHAGNSRFCRCCPKICDLGLLVVVLENHVLFEKLQFFLAASQSYNQQALKQPAQANPCFFLDWAATAIVPEMRCPVFNCRWGDANIEKISTCSCSLSRAESCANNSRMSVQEYL